MPYGGANYGWRGSADPCDWSMDHHHGVSTEDARQIGERIGIDWGRSAFDVAQFRMHHRALELGRLVAAEHHAKLSACQAVSTPAYLCLGYLASPAPVEAVSIPREVDQARERIAALGGVELHATYGDPVEELTLYSASLDLLVIGSRGYGPLGRLV